MQKEKRKLNKTYATLLSNPHPVGARAQPPSYLHPPAPLPPAGGNNISMAFYGWPPTGYGMMAEPGLNTLNAPGHVPVANATAANMYMQQGLQGLQGTLMSAQLGYYPYI